MMKKCPECSGQMPENYEECPFCGCIQDSISSPDISSEDEPFSVKKQKEEEEEEHVFSLKRLFLEFFIFVISLFIIGVIVLATDFKGARTELRRVCMTDSGDGSGSDTQHSRIRVKHYILVFLDLFDHGGTGSSTRINQDAFKKRTDSGPDTSVKTERDVLESQEIPELPPAPPTEIETKSFSEDDSVKTDVQPDIPAPQVP